MAPSLPLRRIIANGGERPTLSQASLLACRLTLDEGDLGALLQQLRQPVDIPVGEAHAAVRFRFADFRGIRRAVKAAWEELQEMIPARIEKKL